MVGKTSEHLRSHIQISGVENIKFADHEDDCGAPTPGFTVLNSRVQWDTNVLGDESNIRICTLRLTSGCFRVGPLNQKQVSLLVQVQVLRSTH